MQMHPQNGKKIQLTTAFLKLLQLRLPPTTSRESFPSSAMSDRPGEVSLPNSFLNRTENWSNWFLVWKRKKKWLLNALLNWEVMVANCSDYDWKPSFGKVWLSLQGEASLDESLAASKMLGLTAQVSERWRSVSEIAKYEKDTKPREELQNLCL